MDFNTRLKEEIEFADIRYKELAEKSGVPERALYNYVAKKNPSMPPADVAVKIAQVLGVSVEYLVMGKPVNFPDCDIVREICLFQKYRHLLQKMDSLPKNAQECLDFFVEKMSGNHSRLA